MNDVVLNGDIATALDNPKMATTAYQIQGDQMMAIICQMTENNKILRDQLKQLFETNAFLDRQDQDDKTQLTIMIVNLQKCIQTDIVGLVNEESPWDI